MHFVIHFTFTGPGGAYSYEGWATLYNVEKRRDVPWALGSFAPPMGGILDLGGICRDGEGVQ